mmetsp:Transcript_75891/g.175983  ORF Transcript_75891/g.175983 Transcript_75891/m.175983 type:complete len:179 (+) Transcript_75891:72-608(+)
MVHSSGWLSCLAIMLSLLGLQAYRSEDLRTLDVADAFLDNTGKGQELNGNKCKDLDRNECIEMRWDCVWNQICRPKTCRLRDKADCEDDRCTWKGAEDTNIGGCLELPKAPPKEPKLRKNLCKDLDSGECRQMMRFAPCKWVAETHSCRPKACDGIEEADCKELGDQCQWLADKCQSL